MSIFSALEIVYSWVTTVSIFLLFIVITIKQENVLILDIIGSMLIRIALILLACRHGFQATPAYVSERLLVSNINVVGNVLIIAQILFQAKNILHIACAATIGAGEMYYVMGGGITDGWIWSAGLYWAIGILGFICIVLQWTLVLKAPLRPWVRMRLARYGAISGQGAATSTREKSAGLAVDEREERRALTPSTN